MSVLQRIWKIGWLCWRPTRDTWMAFGAGLAVIALSVLFLAFQRHSLGGRGHIYIEEGR